MLILKIIKSDKDENSKAKKTNKTADLYINEISFKKESLHN